MSVEDVHSVAAHPGHAERLPLALEVGDGRVAAQGGAHAELVVDHHEDHRQAPQGGEVECLAEGALVGGPIAEGAQRYLLTAALVTRECDAGGDREVASDDSIATHEAPGGVEHVHRSTMPF